MDSTALRILKRKQLQSVAIHHGIKANLKSDAIIQLLITKFPSGVPLISDSLASEAPPNTDATSSNARLSEPRASPSRKTTEYVDATSHVAQGRSGPGDNLEITSSLDNLRPEAGPSQPSRHAMSLGIFGLPSGSHISLLPALDKHSSIPTASTSQRRSVSEESPDGPHVLHSQHGTQHESASAPLSVPAGFRQTYEEQFSYSYPPVQPPVTPYAPSISASSRHQGALRRVYYAGIDNDPPSSAAVCASSGRSRYGSSSSDPDPDPNPSRLACQHAQSNSSPQLSPAPSPSSIALLENAADEVAPPPAEPHAPASDEQLYDAVRRMADIARFQQETRVELLAVKEEDERMQNDIKAMGFLVQQERAHFDRMKAYMDHVHPTLSPKWREDVIWDKACPTYMDEDGNLVEYDTDDDSVPNSPAPVMIKFFQTQDALPPDAEKPAEDAGERANDDVPGSGDTEPVHVTPPPGSKRQRPDENEPPRRVAKRMRQGAPATPAPSARPSRVTRSATKKIAAEQRTMGKIAEEEEEQDMISVLSILTQPIDDDTE